MKRIFTAAIVLFSLITAAMPHTMAASEQSSDSVHSFWIDETSISIENLKEITDEDGIGCVPIRAIAEKLNFNIEWDGSNQTAKLDKEGLHIEIKIGDDAVKKNDDIIQLNTAAKLIDDFTYVPTRFVSNILESVQ